MDGNKGYQEYYTGENEVNDKKVVRIVFTVVIAVLIALSSFFIGFYTHKLTQSQNLASLEWALSVIDQYYYFSEEFDGEQAHDASLKGIASLLDRYSEYYTAEEYAALINSNSGEKQGIGISYNFVEGRGAVIVSVMENSPACKQGLRSGDVIKSGACGGESVNFSVAEDFTKFMDARKNGEKFTLNTEDGSVTLSKEAYSASYAFLAMRDTAWECVSYGEGKSPALVENRQRAISYLPEGSAYINLSQFYGGMADEFGALMSKFNAQGCTSMYLDLRNNGGGYVSVMQDVAGYFTSSLSDEARVAMTAEYKNGRKEVYDCVRHTGSGLVPEDTTVYVLANSGTASASEALIGVLVSYGIVDYGNIFISDYSQEYLDWAGDGAKTAQTYGKGIMQSTFVNYKTGEALKLTTARIYWPNGKCIHDVALSAKDGCRLVEAEWTATKGDSELKRVVELTR